MIVDDTQIKKATPMMQQYLSSKAQHKDCLLFFRMGDFYELFYDDAVLAAPLLGVALTRRGKSDGQDIPMCGVPHHSVDLYIKKLIKIGHKVALCDQLESPEEARKRGGASAVVKRDVVRIITPGTLTEENLLESKASNYLASVVLTKEEAAIAYIDASTLDFYILPTTQKALANDLVRINPAELLVSDEFLVNPDFKDSLEEFRSRFVVFANYFFDEKKCTRKLQENFNLQTIEGIGNFSQAQLSASGALIEYLCLTQKLNTVTLHFPKLLNSADYVVIDRSTIRNLEVFDSITERGKSLFQVIDYTITNAGGRMLRNFLAFPSRCIKKINARQHLTSIFIENAQLRESVEGALKQMPDTERATARIAFGRGAPRDLYSIRQALESASKISQAMNAVPNSALNALASKLLKASSVLELLNSTLIRYDIYLNYGDYILRGTDRDLDLLYNYRDNSKDILDNLKEEYIHKTGIQNIKLEFNNLLGYYLEVTKSQAPKIQSDEFIHRQTMVNGVRYVTEKLKEVEAKLLNTKSQIADIEAKIFNEVGKNILSNRTNISVVAQTCALVDVIHSFAKLALEKKYSMPVLDESCDIEIKDGRHPVVECSELKGSDEFIANDCNLKEQQKLWLITGPNMSGKSTFLRQNALIVLLAHIGSFVPAYSARIGIVDRIFSRIGAEDDLSRGRSTFLVEMVETASILNQGTEKSLIILDEVGRGTSTYDGIAIAWSCLEYIHDNIRARTLFSTHYHELVELSANLQNLKCFTVSIKEWNDKVIFMHKLVRGVANKSYGINVAAIAGLPKVVVARAKEVLQALHAKEAALPTLKEEEPNLKPEILQQQKNPLDGINPDNLSPKEALDLLYKLKTH